MEILILFDHKAFFLEICLLQQPGDESEDSVVAEVWLVLQFICAVLDLRASGHLHPELFCDEADFEQLWGCTFS